jgi:hypothetical protein
MPQDKRLIVIKTALQNVRNLAGFDEAAAHEPISLEFVVPSILLHREETLESRIFQPSTSPLANNLQYPIFFLYVVNKLWLSTRGLVIR